MKNKTTLIIALCLGLSTLSYSQDQKENQLLEAIKTDSTNADNYWNLGEYYCNYKKEKYNQVHPLFIKANKLSNNGYYTRPLYNNNAELFTSLERYSETAPSELVYQWLGDVYLYKGRKQEAIVAFEKLLKYRSQDYNLLYNIATCFEQLKTHNDSAMYYYQKSGTIWSTKKLKYEYGNPWEKLFELSKIENNVEYYLMSFDTLMKIDWSFQTNFSEKENYDLVKELKTKPTAATYEKQGDFLFKKSQYAASIKAYEKCIELNPTGKAAIIKKIGKSIKDDAYYTYFDKREYEKSLARYQDALKYTTSDPEIYSAIAYIYMDKLSPSDYKKAIEYYQKCLPLTTGQMEKKDILENIGLCYEQQKDYANAIIYYNKAVAQAPNFAKTAHYKLARVYEAKGDAANTLKHRKLSH